MLLIIDLKYLQKLFIAEQVPMIQTMDLISGTIHLFLVGEHKLALGLAFDNSRF